MIRKAAVPIKKEMIPPMYDNDAKITRNTTGFVVFFVHAMNISGGINPKKDSDKKKMAKMYPVAKTSVIFCSPWLILYTYALTKKITAIIIDNGIIAFFRVLPTKL